MAALDIAELAALGAGGELEGAQLAVAVADATFPVCMAWVAATNNVHGHLMAKSGEHGTSGVGHAARYAGLYSASRDRNAFYATCVGLATKGVACKKKTLVSAANGKDVLSFSNMLAHLRAAHGDLLRKTDRNEVDAVALPDAVVDTTKPTAELVAAMRSVLVIYQLATGLAVNHVSSIAMGYLLRFFGYEPIRALRTAT